MSDSDTKIKAAVEALFDRMDQERLEKTNRVNQDEMEQFKATDCGIYELVKNPKSSPKEIEELLHNCLRNKNSKVKWHYKLYPGGNSALQVAILDKRFDLIAALIYFSEEMIKKLDCEGVSILNLNAKEQNCLEMALQELDQKEALEAVNALMKYPHSEMRILISEYRHYFFGGRSTNDWLQGAIQKNNLAVIKRIISDDHFTQDVYLAHHPFHDAITHNSLECLKYFCTEEKLKINKKSVKENLTPLILAVKQGKLECVKILLDSPMLDINLRISEEQTALHVAFNVDEPAKPNEDIIRLLISKGADMAARNIFGETPTDLAIKKGLLHKLTVIDTHHLDDLLGIFKTRRGLIQSIPMDLRLFAHINNDHRLQGNILEGNQFSNTIAYLTEIIELVQQGKLETGIIETKKYSELFADLAKKLQSLKDLSITFLNTTKEGFSNLKEINNKFISDDQEKLKKIDELLEPPLKKILEILNSNKYVLIPGGWLAKGGGHAMLYEIIDITAEDYYQVSIINSGSGIVYHESAELNRNKFNPYLSFKVPRDKRNLLPALIKELLNSLFVPFWTEQSQDAKKLYSVILKFIARHDIAFHPSTNVEKYIIGQRSGTCSWKVLEAFCKSHLPFEVYEKLQFEFRLQSIIESFSSEFSKGTLGSKESSRQLIDGIQYFARLMAKRLDQVKERNEYERNQKEANLKETTHKEKNQKEKKQYTEILAVLENLLHEIEVQTKASANIQEFDKIELQAIKYNKPVFRPRGGGILGDELHNESLDLKLSREGNYSYNVKYTLDNPLNDVKTLKKLIADFNQNKEKNLYIRNTIQAFLSNIPIQTEPAKKYWGSLKDRKEYYEAMGLLVEIQRDYILSLYNDNCKTFPAYVVAIYTLLAMQTLITQHYFGNEYGPIYFGKELRSILDSRYLNNALFYIDNGFIDFRISELKSFFMSSESGKKLELKDIMTANNISKEQLEKITSQLKDKSGLNVQIDRNLKFGLEDYMIFEILKHAPDKFPEKMIDECNFLGITKLFLTDATYYYAVDENIFNTPKEDKSNNVKLLDLLNIRIEKKEVAIIPFDRPLEFNKEFTAHYGRGETEGYWDKSFQLNFSKPYKSYYLGVGSLFVNEKRDITLFKRFKFDNFYSVRSSNSVQLFEYREDHSAAKQETQQTLHTRTVKSCMPVTTLDYFNSRINKFLDIDYQNLLQINLFNPGVFRSAVCLYPGIISYLIKLIQEGLNYYTDGKTLSYPVHYFFKINFILQSYLYSFMQQPGFEKSNKETFERNLKESKCISDQLSVYMEINAKDCARKESSAQKHKAIILRHQFYYNVLQELELSLNNGTIVDERLLMEYMRAQFTIQSLDIGTEQPMEQIDPSLKECQEKIKFLLAPHIKSYFASRDPQTIANTIFGFMPKSICDILQKETHFEYAFPLLAIGASQENQYIMNIINGTIQKSGFTVKPMPRWAKELKDYKNFATQLKHDPEVVLVDDSNALVEFTFEKQRYRVSRKKASGLLYKEIEINHDIAWYQLQTGECTDLRLVPSVIYDNNYFTWVALAKKRNSCTNYVMTNLATKQDQYVIWEGKLYCLPLQEKDNYVLQNICDDIELSHEITPSKSSFDFLKRFEHFTFIEIKRKEIKDKFVAGDIVINLPRYNISFATHDSKQSCDLISLEDPKFKLSAFVHTHMIPGFSSYLELMELVPNAGNESRKTQVLIPRLPFVSTSSKSIDLDKAGIIISDELNLALKDPDADVLPYYQWWNPLNPFQWNLKGQGDYYKIALNDKGRLEPSQSTEALYLCYLCCGTNNPELASQYYHSFIKLGGLTGSRSEAEILYWFLEAIPYQIKSKKMSGTCKDIAFIQKDNIISSPELIALRAQLLTRVFQFLSSQKKFKLKDKSNKNNEWNSFIVDKLSIYFTISNLIPRLKELLHDYHQIKNNISTALKLNTEDHYFLYTYIQSSALPYSQGKLLLNLHRDYFSSIQRITNNRLHEILTLSLDPRKAFHRLSIVNKELRLPGISTVHEKLNEKLVVKRGLYDELPVPINELNNTISIEKFCVSFQSYYHYCVKNEQNETDDKLKILLEFSMIKVREYMTLLNFEVETSVETSKGNLNFESALPYLCTILLYAAQAPETFCKIPLSVENRSSFYPQFNHMAFFEVIQRLQSTKPIVLKIPGKICDLAPTSQDKESTENRATISLNPERKTELALLNRPVQAEITAVSQIIEQLNIQPQIIVNRVDKLDRQDIEVFDKKSIADDIVGFEGINLLDYNEGIKQNRLESRFKQWALSQLKLAHSRISLKHEISKSKERFQPLIHNLISKLEEIFNPTPKDETLLFRSKLTKISFETSKTCFDDIIKHLLKGNLLNVINDLYPNDEKIHSECLALIAKILTENTTLQHYQRILEQIEKLDKECLESPNEEQLYNNLSKLVEILFASRCFNYGDKEFFSYLIFENSENVLIRENQKKMLDLILQKPDETLKSQNSQIALNSENFKNVIFQLLMGAGKTKFIVPNAAFIKAKGTNLVIKLVPQGLLETNQRDLQLTSNRSLYQQALPFHFDRYTDCSVINLQNILNYFVHCIIQRNYLVCTQIDMPSIELKWIELLSKKEVNEKQIILIEQILDLIDNQGDVFIDEIDSLLDVRKELNYTMGDIFHGLRSETIEDTIKLYSLFKLVQFDYSGKKWKLSDIFTRDFPQLKETEWKILFSETIADLLVHVLLTDKNSFFTPILEKLRKIIDPEKNAFETILAKDLTEGGKLKASLDLEPKPLPNFMLHLSKSEQHTVALCKEQICKLLPLTLDKKPNKHYGRLSQLNYKENFEHEIAIPYIANDVPSKRSQFASPYETLNYTIQINKIFGLTSFVVKQFIETLQNQANHEKILSGGLITSTDSTEAGKLFKELTHFPRSLASIDVKNLKEMEEIYNLISKESDVVDYCLEHFILTKIKIHPVILRHNSLNHTSMYRSFQGGSGTILSPFIFDERSIFESESAIGTDGRTIDHLISKNTTVHLATTNDPFVEIAKLLKQNNKMRAIIDVGSYFYGISNFDVAHQLSKIFSEFQDHPIKYILFYNKQNKLCAINAKDPNQKLKLIGSTEPQVIKDILNCEPYELFTYYDELRTTGTDIIQMLNAQAIVTVGSATLLRDFLQGAMRLRGLSEGQAIEVLIPKTLHEPLNILKWDIRTVLSFTEKAQRVRILQDNFRAALYKIKNIFRKDLLTLLRLERNAAQKQVILKEISPILFTKSEDSPFDLFANVEGLELTNQVLKREQKNWLSFWKNSRNTLNRSPKAELEKELILQTEAIIDKASRVCDRYSTIQRETQDTEVQTVTEARTTVLVQTKLETNQKTELQTKLSVDKPYATEAQTYQWPYQGIDLSKFSLFTYKPADDTYYFRAPKLYSFNDLMQSGGSLSSLGFSFNKQLFVSENYKDTVKDSKEYLINSFVKPVHYVLFIQNNNENSLEALLITQEEAEYFSQLLIKIDTIENLKNASKYVWITTLNELILVGEKPVNVNPLYHTILEQLWYFNGDTMLLSKNIERLKWIREDMAEKLAYYEKVILMCHPDKAEIYPHFKERLLKGTDIHPTFLCSYPLFAAATQALSFNDNKPILPLNVIGLIAQYASFKP